MDEYRDVQMPERLAELAKVGFFALAGVYIDFLLSETEKQKVRDWLETWWYRFDELKLLKLGHAEAQAAIAYSDELVGLSGISTSETDLVS